MIRYALICHDCEAEFEAWFASSEAYDDQSKRGLVTCAACNSASVGKQIMAPAVSGTKRSARSNANSELAEKVAAAARQHVAENFDYVGRDFASEARAMYYGDAEERPIWGATTAEEAKALKEEGVPAAPLPEPFTPPRPREPDESLN
ncbi:MAG: DUF1178 family protein [Hyphomonadaceae bacterium]|nr:DUF1178 family protein [Hyphomonadaceae bacterium]